MSMNTIDKAALTEVLVNVGQNGCFTGTFLDMFCLIFVFKHSINYEINKIKKKKEYCMFESFIKQKGQLGYTYIVLWRACCIY
jgi:hypothetical protein